jgi:hypothetical protein
MIRIHLSKSDAMMYGSNLDEPARYSTPQERLIEVDGSWVQMTYEFLQGEDGRTIAVMRDGLWVTDDGDEWSDVVVEYLP